MADPYNFRFIADPIKFGKALWPHRYFYSKQREAIYSHVEDDKTVLPWGNMLGKDYITAFICLYFILTRNPVRVVTTSAKDDHLRVLWGEVNDYIATAAVPLDAKRGGPLIINHQDIRKVFQSGPQKGEKCPLSYMIGMVASQETIAAMQGHHIAKTGDGIPRTLFVADECSSVPDDYYSKANTWANRMLLIGNTWPCSNFFWRAVEGDPAHNDPGGNIARKHRGGFHRRVITCTAEDSPNVQLALEQQKAGKPVTGLTQDGKLAVPGVKDWEEFQKNLLEMNEIEKTICLYAKFYKGKEQFMFPPQWLIHSMRWALKLKTEGRGGKAEAMGVDPAEGGDSSVWTVIDRLGIIEQISLKTPKTTDVTAKTKFLIDMYDIPPEKVLFDAGGGGKEHADRLKLEGYDVECIAFGANPSLEPRRGLRPIQERKELKIEHYAFFNLRAEMYWGVRSMIDPSNSEDGEGSVFAIPPDLEELHRQLRPMPLLHDSEGKIKMLPKDKRGQTTSKEPTLKQLLGCSPDEADSLVLAVHALRKKARPVAGAI